eukprot:4290305-Amphidinium_carterae.1
MAGLVCRHITRLQSVEVKAWRLKEGLRPGNHKSRPVWLRRRLLKRVNGYGCFAKHLKEHRNVNTAAGFNHIANAMQRCLGPAGMSV